MSKSSWQPEGAQTGELGSSSSSGTGVRYLWRTSGRDRVQVNSQDSGTAEIVGSAGMRMVMVMRMSVNTVVKQEVHFCGVIPSTMSWINEPAADSLQLEDERTLSNYNSRVLKLHSRGSMLLWLASLCKGARPQSKKV